MSVMDDWEEDRHEGIVGPLDPTGERERDLDSGWTGPSDDGPFGQWETQRHNYNTEHELEE